MKNLKIGIQLILGFATMMLFVVVLGAVAYLQTGKINLQIENLLNHPFKVRVAISRLDNEILKMQVGLRDLMLAKTEPEKEEAIQVMKLSAANAHNQFDILNDQYLGPKSDIDEAYKSFIIWKTAREEITKLILSGDIESARKSAMTTGKLGISREQLLTKIGKIDNFATNKAIDLNATSTSLNNTLNRQIIQLVVFILFLSSLISYFLIRNIRKPINELSRAVIRFKNGDRTTRSSYHSLNEFGILSDSFNSMVNDIEINSVLNERVTSLAALMLNEYEERKFFQSIINALAEQTGSQMSAIYLRSEDLKTFDHFESIGLDTYAKQSFSANTFEGEFGFAISSRKVQHIKNIPENTQFIFNAVSGKYIPHEIITLPIVSENEVVAIISLATIKSYDEISVQLIDRVFDILTARIDGILAFRKLKVFSEKLEFQNLELQAQKTELAAQSSELIQQNAELETQKKQLFHASSLKTNFLSNMSHELRTPLNSVIALSGVLNRRLATKIPEDEYSYLEVIERNGKHLLSMINDILDISRIEAGREEVEISRVNVSKLVSEVASMIYPQAQMKKIDLRYNSVNPDLCFATDSHKCRHILQNLIGNAVKFTENGIVEISAHQIGEKIEIYVFDTGIGISENHLPHIFDEFRQADGSTSRKFGGTGLGLAIAKKYANLLGGTISVKSTLNQGSVFALTLPLQYSTENEIIEEHQLKDLQSDNKYLSAKPNQGATKKTILLVEDSEPAIVQLKDVLEGEGFIMLVAHNGSEALEIIAKTIPDMMILDLMMPGMDGFEVLRIIRDAEPTAHIPVLVLTAKQITKEELRYLKRNNVHQLIQKGDVNRKELLRTVHDMVFQNVSEPIVLPGKPQLIDGKPTVLVVEDNQDNMTTVKALLADDYIILEAADGNEGVAMAKNFKPNLILMDIALPGMDGIEAFKIIRKDDELQNIPVIALTASAMTSDRETILANGMDAYIVKPIDDEIFFKTINNLLHGK